MGGSAGTFDAWRATGCQSIVAPGAPARVPPAWGRGDAGCGIRSSTAGRIPNRQCRIPRPSRRGHGSGTRPSTTGTGSLEQVAKRSRRRSVVWRATIANKVGTFDETTIDRARLSPCRHDRGRALCARFHHDRVRPRYGRSDGGRNGRTISRHRDVHADADRHGAHESSARFASRPSGRRRLLRSRVAASPGYPANSNGDEHRLGHANAGGDDGTFEHANEYADDTTSAHAHPTVDKHAGERRHASLW